VEALLAPGERAVAWFGPDLDSGLNFADKLVVLTNRRILTNELAGARPASDSLAANPAPGWASWPFDEIASLQLQERVGYGVVKLLGHSALLATWPFTMAKSTGRLAW
jgi:hypothetical protein